MPVLVTKNGFQPLDRSNDFVDKMALVSLKFEEQKTVQHLSLTADDDLSGLYPLFESLQLIEVTFTSFADGRGFSLAKRLRLGGFKGRLRASGHVLADQFRLAIQVGFDEVAISDDLANRQPERQWMQQFSPGEITYQQRLMKRRTA